MHLSVFMWLWIFTYLICYSASQDMCTNINFDDLDPCGVSAVLISSQGFCNKIVSPDAATNEPTIEWKDANNSSLYILFMVDPDAPDPKSNHYKYWVHWIVTDIKGSDLRRGQINGNKVMPYNGPTPPRGVHRYQFFLFEQPPNFDGKSLVVENRFMFNLSTTVSKYNLCLKAAYQYAATNDFVPEPDQTWINPGITKGPITPESSEDMCTNINFDNIDPCGVSAVLISSQGYCNQTISPDAASTEPTLQWEGADSSLRYILFMVDPDAPDPTNNYYKYWVHWIKADIEGSDLIRGQVSGNKVISYEKPNPTGVHRVQFFLFEQPPNFDGQTLFVDMRFMYNLSTTVAKYNLCLKAAYQYLATKDFIPTGSISEVPPVTPESSEDMCTNIDFDNLDPCRVSVVLDIFHRRCNQLFSASDIADEPTIEWKDADNAAMYILFLVDPDEPDPDDPAFRYWVQWIVVDLKGSDLRRGLVNGENVMPYEKPDPLTGVHRYQFFLFEQPLNFDVKTLVLEDRGRFDIADFVASHNLCLKAAHQYFATYLFKPEANQTWVYTRGVSGPIVPRIPTDGAAIASDEPDDEEPVAPPADDGEDITNGKRTTEQLFTKPARDGSHCVSAPFKATLFLLSYLSYVLA